jgi:hypothetical protein
MLSLLLPLLKSPHIPLWDRIFDSPPSSPPSPWEKKKQTNKKKKPTTKRKHQLPREGQQTVEGEGWKKRRTTEGKGSQIPRREGQGVAERRGVRAVAAPFLCHPCPLSRGLQHN